MKTMELVKLVQPNVQAVQLMESAMVVRTQLTENFKTIVTVAQVSMMMVLQCVKLAMPYVKHVHLQIHVPHVSLKITEPIPMDNVFVPVVSIKLLIQTTLSHAENAVLNVKNVQDQLPATIVMLLKTESVVMTKLDIKLVSVPPDLLL